VNAYPRNRERGSVTMLMGASLIFFFGFVALTVDIGFLYMTQRRAQAIADMAAIAGASKLSVSQAAATNAAKAIETANGYPTATPSYPSTQRIQVDLATPSKSLFFGRIFRLTAKTLHVTAVASAGTPVPAIWAGGGCLSTTGLQLNGGPFNVKGSIVSKGPLNYYTGGAGTTDGDVKNSSACATPPATTGTVTGTTGQDPPGSSEFTDPFGYNMATDFPACSAGTNLTTVVGTYNVPMAGGVIAPGVYCANGNVNISSGSPIVGTGVTILATGVVTISGNGLTMSAAAGTHNIVIFAGGAGTSGDCFGITSVQFGFPGITLNGSVYAPNGCINMSGDGFTLNGSMVGKEVQFGAGMNWTVDASTAGTIGSTSLYQ
jgi:Flp pilus assembly protein TadG